LHQKKKVATEKVATENDSMSDDSNDKQKGKIEAKVNLKAKMSIPSKKKEESSGSSVDKSAGSK